MMSTLLSSVISPRRTAATLFSAAATTATSPTPAPASLMATGTPKKNRGLTARAPEATDDGTGGKAAETNGGVREKTESSKEAARVKKEQRGQQAPLSP